MSTSIPYSPSLLLVYRVPTFWSARTSRLVLAPRWQPVTRRWRGSMTSQLDRPGDVISPGACGCPRSCSPGTMGSGRRRARWHAQLSSRRRRRRWQPRRQQDRMLPAMVCRHDCVAASLDAALSISLSPSHPLPFLSLPRVAALANNSDNAACALARLD